RHHHPDAGGTAPGMARLQPDPGPALDAQAVRARTGAPHPRAFVPAAVRHAAVGLDDVLRPWVPGELVWVLAAAGSGAVEQAAVRGAGHHPWNARLRVGGGGGTARRRSAQASFRAEGRRVASYAANFDQPGPGNQAMRHVTRAALGAALIFAAAGAAGA